MIEGRAEEFSLTRWCNAGNNDDHSGVQWFLSVKSKKIRTIVGYKCIVSMTDGGHELPIFRTTQTEIVDVISYVTSRMGYFDQRRVQAFVDQKLHPYPTRARLCRVVSVGFRLAQGREAGRPRRGKAWT
jgi:hypothetical protein